MTPSLGYGAVIVNYNAARFALDAALSFIGAGGKRVVIVDNASPDDSMEFFQRALSGEVPHEPEEPCRDDVDAQVSFESIWQLRWSIADEGEDGLPEDQITIVSARSNRGFAAGVNIGLIALIAQGFERFLVLNPDATTTSSALDAFEERLSDKKIGLCGASVLNFKSPHSVQALGGACFNPIFLTGQNLYEGRSKLDGTGREEVEDQIAYPLGAAMAFRKDFLQEAGFLDERYFLYYEEIDWVRSGAKRFRVGWAPDAIVFHRYGASTGSEKTMSKHASKRSPLGDYHMVRSRISFAAKWSPWLVPLSVMTAFGQIALRLIRGQFKNAWAILNACRPFAPRGFEIR